jgi:hypothetical protein
MCFPERRNHSSPRATDKAQRTQPIGGFNVFMPVVPTRSSDEAEKEACKFTLGLREEEGSLTNCSSGVPHSLRLSAWDIRLVCRHQMAAGGLNAHLDFNSSVIMHSSGVSCCYVCLICFAN